ncbi:MAG: hypothetical protein V3T56_01745 [Gemmatimonadales bacterium]
MKALRKFVTVLAISGIAVACGDDNPVQLGNGNGGVTVADLAGAYTASSFAYTMIAPPNTVIDLIALTGEVTVNLSSDGSFTATLLLPGQTVAVPFSGTISLSGTTLTLTVSTLVVAGPITLDPADPFVFDVFTLSGNQLTLSASMAEFDFTLCAAGPPCTEVPATLVLILNR